MGRLVSRIALWSLALGLAGVATAEPSIRFAEPVQLTLATGASEFDAYGRRFSLSLAGNDRVLHKIPAQQKASLGSYRLLRGSVAGAPGSWVRLTETPRGVEGAIWDGEEFYAVTRYENVAPFLTTPLDAAPGQTVVYRLSDARDALPADFCASGEVAKAEGLTALDQYKSLVAEMQTGGVVGPSVTRQVEISLIADSAFQQDDMDPTATMLARLNIVEGIFSEQVGLLIIASDIRLIPRDSDPFTSTKGSTLLDQLSAYRVANPAVRARGIAHLMTGKDLDGTTAGIAFVRTVCEKERGVSLSQRSYGTTISALVMAHELGHNFGATHDGEQGTVCASTPGGFIMASSVTGYGTFSQCSIDVMKPVLAGASCVTAAQFADVVIEPADHALQGEGGLPFTLPFVVRSAGNMGAEGAEFTLSLPPSMSYRLDAASSTRGSCTVSGFTASCSLGELEPGEAAELSVTGRGTQAGSITAQARVSAANDRITSNNNAQVHVTLRSGIDARVAVSTSAAELAVGAPLEVYADVTSMRAMAVGNALLSVNLNQPVTGATVSGGLCTVNATSVTCSIAEIPTGSTRRLTVQATAQNAGPLYASASVSAAGDGDLANNNAAANAWVQAERDLEIVAPATSLELPVGVVQEIAYTLRARGPLGVDGAELLLTLPGTLAVEGIDAGVTCVHPSDYVWRCALGSLVAGETRVVRLRFHATAPTSGDIAAVATSADDGYAGNNSMNLRLRIDHQVDLGIALASGGFGVEDTPFDGQVALSSGGRLAAANGVLHLTLNAAGRFSAVRINHGDACELLADHRARCQLPTLARGSTLYVDYTAEFAEPGNYDIAFSASAPEDSAPANDTLTRPVLVRPYFDASVTGSLKMDGLFGEQTRVQTFTVRTDRRGLATARLQAAHAAPALRVEAISAGIGECRVDEELGGLCDFTDLPPHAAVAVSVTYRAFDGSSVVQPSVSISTPGDVLSANNAVSAKVETLGATDLELRVSGSVSGPRSTSLTFPTIQVQNGASKAMAARLEVKLPDGVTLDDISASDGICSGSTTLRCDFDTLEPFEQASVSLTVRASANGSFASNVKLSAINDVNPANDSRDVPVEIGGETVAQSNSPTGGGGGRMEWLALLLLGTLVAGRRGRFAAAR